MFARFNGLPSIETMPSIRSSSTTHEGLGSGHRAAAAEKVRVKIRPKTNFMLDQRTPGALYGDASQESCRPEMFSEASAYQLLDIPASLLVSLLLGVTCQHIDFDVHRLSGLERAQIGDLKRMRDYRD